MNFFNRAQLPDEPLEAITTIAPGEVSAHLLGGDDDELAKVWDLAVALYRSGIHPAVQICIRRHGEIVMHRSIGYARGVGPDSEPDEAREVVGLDTPFNVFSASKAITATLIHLLDERGVLHVDDFIANYIPEFARHGKDQITIKHLLNHRAGISAMPKHAMDLDVLNDRDGLLEMVCEMKPSTRPGGRLAYHALSSGFIFAELVQRTTGKDIRRVMREEIVEPLGMRWGNYGVAPRDVDKVVQNHCTGAPILPPFDRLIERLLGVGLQEAVTLSNDKRFLTAVVPSANVVTNAEELSLFYQMLLDGGEANGKRVLDPRTIRRATAEQAWMEPDLNLIAPIRYSQGFMLGADYVSVFGPDTDKAFGHIGLTNIFGWADPDRQIAAALMTSGKPLIYPEFLSCYSIPWQTHTAFDKTEPRPRVSPARRPRRPAKKAAKRTAKKRRAATRK